MIDALIVGSGPSAVHAAWPLAEAGLRVRMLDFGNRDEHYAPLLPDAPFERIRRDDAQQYRYLLGDRFEGIDFGRTGAGAQLTPPRQYVCRDSDRLTPVESEEFHPLESLALGGLSGAWGAGCPPFEKAAFAGLPVTRADLDPHYAAVAGRIGISGARDDLLSRFGDLPGMQPAPALDSNATTILDGYRRRSDALNARGFRLGHPRLALLTEPLAGRGPSRYQDMDFWSDADRAVYRSRYTVAELERFPGFEYRAPRLVDRFEQREDGSVQVFATDPATGQHETHGARRLILAAGTLGTTRIVARSLGLYDRPLPLVCNPHVYMAMLNRHMLGRLSEGPRHSLAQLCFTLDAKEGCHAATVGHVYSYRSLLLFRLLKDSPMPVPDSLPLLRRLLPALTVVIVQHADRPTPQKRCSLTRDSAGGPDRLSVSYRLSGDERKSAAYVERQVRSSFRRIGCYCFRTSHPGQAASVHYAGTFPMTVEQRELTTDGLGRLRGSRLVHLVDGSVLPHLPSSGLTFTLMANADRIGTLLARELLG